MVFRPDKELANALVAFEELVRMPDNGLGGEDAAFAVGVYAALNSLFTKDYETLARVAASFKQLGGDEEHGTNTN